MRTQKDAFSLPPDLHYLNCAYMAPLARSVEEAGIAGVRLRRDPTALAPADFFTDSEVVRERFARLINAPEPSSIAIIPAVSYGMAIVARNVALDAGQNIVVLGEQFPSNIYPWRRLASDSGAELRTVAAPTGDGRAEGWNARVLHAIDARTGLVAVPNVHWTDGTRFDLERIGARAREVGALLVVDGTQSVGALPFDVQRIRPDALVVAGYKWLLGPYGLGVTYLGPRFAEGVPLEENWINRAGSEDFESLVDYRDEYLPGSVRYDFGERSNPILLPMLAEGLRFLLEWTPEAIQEYCAALSQEAIEEARGLGFQVEDARWRGAHLFGLRVPAGVPRERVEAELQAERVSISVRGESLRISPHLYNDAADMEALVTALRRAVTG